MLAGSIADFTGMAGSDVVVGALTLATLPLAILSGAAGPGRGRSQGYEGPNYGLSPYAYGPPRPVVMINSANRRSNKTIMSTMTRAVIASSMALRARSRVTTTNLGERLAMEDNTGAAGHYERN
jgi:hypothetical protein